MKTNLNPLSLLRRYRRGTLLAAIFIAAAAVGVWLLFRIYGSVVYDVPSTADYPIRGVDLSSHNGDVDFDTLPAQGITFAIIKASEGNSFKDPRFLDNLKRARRAGLKVGAYHFFRFDSPGYMQALNLLHSLRGQQLDLPVVIDVEEWTNPDDVSTSRIVGQLSAMMYHLEQAGYRVMIYTNKDGYQRFVRGRFDDSLLWLCSFPRISDEINWHIRQYTHHGSLEGIRRNVDLNVFNGDSAAWARFLRHNLQ